MFASHRPPKLGLRGGMKAKRIPSSAAFSMMLCWNSALVKASRIRCSSLAAPMKLRPLSQWITLGFPRSDTKRMRAEMKACVD
uniref:Putative secreted protein n=1 Tax=Anopheles darlingi TaxID=43151 RepID=A0A2M4D179_ANODA